MPGRLKDKVAIVTGGGGGIGSGICVLMAEEGAKVVVNDVGSDVSGKGESASPTEKVVEQIKSSGGEAISNYDSVTTAVGGENIIKAALDNFGRLDIIITPAGILRDRMVFNMTEEEWDDVIAVHLKGTFNVLKPASIIFRQQRSGRIITFSSTSGLYGNSGQSNYGAAKDAIAGLTRVLAKDLGRYGVTANSISPSADTRMTMTVPDTARELRAASGIMGASTAAPMKLRREGWDIAPMAVWLATDQSADVNGYVFYVSGGVISLLNNPDVGRTMHKKGRWKVEEIAAMFDSNLGMDLPNPAPPRTVSG